jgi:hypothetical protein
MATATQVPWTTPGGTPCCCNFCSNNEIASFYQFIGVPTSFQSAVISEATFAAIKLYGISVSYQFNVGVGSLQPGPINTTIQTDPIASCGPNIIVPISTGSVPGTLLLYSNNGLYSALIQCSFSLFIQDGGTGWPGQPSSPSPSTESPVVFVSSSTLGESVIFSIDANSASGINGYRAAFGNKYGSSGAATTSFTLFGQSRTITVENSIASTLSISIDVAAP